MGQSLDWIKEKWKLGDYGAMLVLIFNRLPQLTYPRGEDAYNGSVVKYGVETWYAPHNLWREIFHMMGGFFLTISFVFLPVFCMVLNGVIFGALIGKEVAFDAQEAALDFKNFLDAFCWAVGSCLVTVLAFLIS